LTTFATSVLGSRLLTRDFFRTEQKPYNVQRRLKEEKEHHSELSDVDQSRMHERIKWRREDFAHKLSRRFVDEFGVIAFEDLNVKDMVKTGVLLKASRHGINTVHVEQSGRGW